MKEKICYFAPPGKKTPLYFGMVGVSYCDGSYLIHRKKETVTVIEYVHSGSGHLTVDGKEYTARAGDIYILHAGTVHTYTSSATDPWKKSFFNIYGSLAENLLSAYRLGKTVVIRGFDRPELFLNLHKKFMQPNAAQVPGLLETAALELHTLIQALANFNLKSRQADAPDAEFHPVLEYLAQNTNTITSNKQLAEMIYRSEDYLVKGFRRFYGTTPYKYQLELKMDAARQLLAQTQLPVSVVGEMVGYNDAMYFSNIFKSKCGISPLQYRKNNQYE